QQLQLQLKKQLHLAMHQSSLRDLHNTIPSTTSLQSHSSIVDPASFSHSISLHTDSPNTHDINTIVSPPPSDSGLSQLDNDNHAPHNVPHQSVNPLDPRRSNFESPSMPAFQSTLKSNDIYRSFTPSFTSMVSQAPEPPFPSVQELSLTLSADIDVHRLWKTITEILSQKFHATRITLCLPQAPTAVVSSVESSHAWGLKAHWDYRHHFLDENTVTPKDEYVHQHHRLQRNASLSHEGLGHQSPHTSVSSHPLPSSLSSSSSFSSTSSSSFSRRRAARSNNSFSINLNGDYSNNRASNAANSSNGSSNINGNTNGPGESRKYVVIPDIKSDYHKDYWNTNPPLDGGYSSSTSTSSVSSYSSTSSSAMQASRATTHMRGFGLHSSGTECFSNLQPLEYDPEPLLNERTVSNILKASKTVVLTREYTGSKNERRKKSRIRSYNQDADDDYDDDSCFTDTDLADDTMEVGEVEVGGSESNRMTQDIHTEASSNFEQDAIS
ncbi:hypothetical protein BGZ49_003843, partial [Haplosporangium sp. Z 27]